MRLWSIHPQHLDSKGLVALWREALLAQHVLDQKTTGYRSHPQLIRFRNAKKPLDAINQYLSAVYAEAEKRNYHFDKSKIDWNFEEATIEVTDGQLKYEARHLLNKLSVRCPEKYNELIMLNQLLPHPMFRIIAGNIEDWEKR
jgi:hypothetical protein